MVLVSDSSGGVLRHTLKRGQCWYLRWKSLNKIHSANVRKIKTIYVMKRTSAPGMKKYCWDDMHRHWKEIWRKSIGNHIGEKKYLVSPFNVQCSSRMPYLHTLELNGKAKIMVLRVPNPVPQQQVRKVVWEPRENKLFQWHRKWPGYTSLIIQLITLGVFTS